MPKNKELIGDYVFEKFRFENVGGDCLISDVVNKTGAAIATKGPEPKDGFIAGRTYRFYGHWTTYKNKYRNRTEDQFLYSSVDETEPITETGAKVYLQRVKGIGQVAADCLWEVYGAAVFEVLREGEIEKIHETTKIRIDVLGVARAMFTEGHNRELSTIELLGLLDGKGFPKSTVESARNRWGVNAAAMIRKNPYILMELSGVGFRRCDQLYLSMKLPPASMRRQAYCAAYGVDSECSSSGSTWVLDKHARAAVKGLIGGAEVRPERAVRTAIRAGLIQSKWTNGSGELDWDGDDRYLADRGRAYREQRLAEMIRAAMQDSFTTKVHLSREELSKHQIDKLKLLSGDSCLRVLGGGPGTGKAQPLDALLLTPKGWKCMGNIQVGEYVFGKGGDPIRVTAVHPQGRKHVYRVTMSDGASTECCDEHLWETTTRNDRKRNRKATVRSLAEISKTLCRRDTGGNNHKIPLVDPIKFPAKELLLDPYVLGVLLAEGSFTSSGVAFSNGDQGIVDEFVKRCPDGATVRPLGNADWSVVFYDRKDNPVKEAICHYGLDGKKSILKFIPKDYLYSPSFIRIRLFQALLDTEAHVDGPNIEFSTSSEAMADDFLFLARSLGCVCTLNSRIPKYTYEGEKREGHVSFRIMVRPPADMTPFLLERKAKAYTPRTKYPASRFIKSIEPIGMKECQCISVDAEDGLYVTDDFIVTHNTYTLARLVKAWLKVIPAGKIALAAPTGKAAVRITESLADAGIKLQATTWHKLLGYFAGGWTYGEDNPLPYQIVIGDEQSMQDTDIAYRAFAARGPGCLYFLIGDVNQLPPVNHGAPLRDMIAAGVPYAELEEVQRNAGEIVMQCKNVRENSKIELHSGSHAAGKNLELVTAADTSEQISAMLAILAGMEDPVGSCQVLTPTNKSGDLGRKNLNQLLQNELNPNPVISGSPFRLGDKVVNTKNGWLKCLEASDDAIVHEKGQVYVANGEVGTIIECEQSRLDIKLDSPSRIVQVYRSKQKAYEGADDDDAVVKPEDQIDTGCKWDLAYALSVHKFQGSETPVAIVMLDARARRLCSREWLYTAISRAKQKCYLVGSKSVAEQMVEVSKIGERKTFLKELIQNAT